MGARLAGPGAGGCTVNPVAKETGRTFAHALATGYEQKTGLHPEIYTCHAADGAEVESIA